MILLPLTALHDTLKAGDTVLVTVTPRTAESSIGAGVGVGVGEVAIYVQWQRNSFNSYCIVCPKSTCPDENLVVF